MSSEWPPGREGGGAAGGAGAKPPPPLPPIPRPPSAKQEDPSEALVQPKALRPAVFSKLENLVREMQDSEHGVPVRSQKLFLTSIPAAFMGYDLIEWLMDRLCIEDSPVEAVHLANLLCQFGYYFPVSEQKNLLVKDDSSLYRFQSPYYWPSQHHTPDNIEYAIYLYKRAQRNKKIHGLEPGLPDYENDALNNLKKILINKWDFVTMQAEEQLKVAKDRKKGDKIVNDSQEKAYWRVYRPPPGYNTLVENSPVPTREQRVKARRYNKELLEEEYEYLKDYLAMNRSKAAGVCESLIEYTDTFIDWDPLLVGVGPSNPWMTDDTEYWTINKPIPDVPSEKRVRRWAVNLENIIMDPLGVEELFSFLKKEYCHENLRFWLSVQELKRGPGSEQKIKKKVKEIYDEFLSKGASAEINIDGATMTKTIGQMKNPSRYTYDQAAEHVYLLLLKKDCYPRFIRSEHYKNLLACALNPGNTRKRFFNFPQVRKKTSQNHPAGQAPGQEGVGGGPRMVDPGDFEIYGMDGTGEDDDQTPLVPADTPRKAQPGTEQNNEACPWEPSGCRPIEAGLARKVSLGAGPRGGERGQGLARPLSLSYLPSEGDNAALPTKSPNSAQLRKKSSSAISADDEIIIRKTSKSSVGVNSQSGTSPQDISRGTNGEEETTSPEGSPGPPSLCAHHQQGTAEEQTCDGKAGEEVEDNGCSGWLPSQDVCPWEDEESCKKESHPPFVKTYATLGYL